MKDVVSKNSIVSKWVSIEIRYAMRKDTLVVPVVIDDAGLQQLPKDLAELQFADFRANYEQAGLSYIDFVVEEHQPRLLIRNCSAD